MCNLTGGERAGKAPRERLETGALFVEQGAVGTFHPRVRVQFIARPRCADAESKGRGEPGPAEGETYCDRAIETCRLPRREWQARKDTDGVFGVASVRSGAGLGRR